MSVRDPAVSLTLSTGSNRALIIIGAGDFLDTNIDIAPDRVDPQRTLEEAFNVRVFSLGLGIAAVFGLTPGLLIERLEAKVYDFRMSLELTSAASAGPGGNP